MRNVESKAILRLPLSLFRPPLSEFPLPHSAFHLPISDFPLPISAFQLHLMSIHTNPYSSTRALASSPITMVDSFSSMMAGPGIRAPG